MIYLHKAGLVILSTPKTGTTAIETRLMRGAALVARHPPGLKHMGYARFAGTIAPVIARNGGARRDAYLVVAMMREPVSALESWYRYRKRPETRPENSTKNMSFSAFVEAFLQREKPAQVGNQVNLFLADGGIGLDRIFAYENFTGFADFVGRRVGRSLKFDKHNMSDARDTELAPDISQRLAARLAPERRFHALLAADGTISDELRALAAAEYAHFTAGRGRAAPAVS